MFSKLTVISPELLVACCYLSFEMLIYGCWFGLNTVVESLDLHVVHCDLLVLDSAMQIFQH